MAMELQNEDRWRPQPGVINTAMIKQAVSTMIKDDLPGINLDDEEGYQFSEIQHLYLEHLNISHIDHLWLMPALTVLKLTGNLIEKIENLETLENLVDLNLSFNKIKKIENLDKLTKLRHLSLFSNLITTIENLDNLTNLRIFTIGNNNIEDKECILQLRKLNLFSLNMAGNPCALEENFRPYVAAYLPKLEYYEYAKVMPEERLTGRSIYTNQLELLEREEGQEEIEAKKASEIAAKEELYSQAFVEGLDGDQLFDAIFDNDPNGMAMLLIGDEVNDIFDQFKEDLGLATTEIFNLGLEQFEIRNKEVEMYNKGSQEAIVRSREKQREILERFLESKANMFVEITNLREILPHESSDEELRKSIDDKYEKAMSMFSMVKRELLNLELVLSEQLKEIFSMFERSLGDMVNSFIEASQGHFTNMREYEATFSEHLGDISSRFLNQLTVRNEDVNTLPPLLRPVMLDKEALNTALATSHDVHLQTIDNREDQLMSRTRGWYNKLCQEAEQEEIARFRGRVYEIVNFLEIQSADFQQYHIPIDEDMVLNDPLYTL